MSRVVIIFLLCISQLVAVSQTDSTLWNFPMETPPQFPGGDAGLMKFVKENLRYPEYERANGIEGRVIVRFIVTETGSVDSVVVLRGVSPGLNAEAVRLVETFPDFKPGRDLRGSIVSMAFNCPIIFKVKEPEPGK